MMSPIRHFSFRQANSSIKGFLFMLFAALMFAIVGLLIKLLGSDYRVWDIAIYRFAGGLIFLFVVFGWKQNLFKPQNPRLLIVRGMTGTVAFVTLVLAIQMIPLSTAMVYFYSYPAFAAIFSPMIFGDRISYPEIGFIGLAIAGVAILFDMNLEGQITGQLMGIISAVFAGLTVAIIKTLRKTHGAVIIYFYFCLIGSTVALVPFSWNPQVPKIPNEWVLILGILFISVIAQLLMNHGFRYCKSWEGGLFMTSEVVFASIIGIFLLSEAVSWRFWTGGILIFMSALAFNLYATRKTVSRATVID